ncbi:hypothetical protein B0O80DRAFT_495612 [Mortierella sp. GBAus27b]|nr:hypothetical protein B0O80DRAFT_495612 [Mortierella sp. GBAus27b]
MAIAEHQTCSITFVSRSLDIPPLATTPNQPFASQCATHLFNVAGEKTNTLVLAGEWYEEAIVDAFARPERIGARLRELYIKSDSMERGDQFIRDVATVVSRFDLDKLVIELRGVKRRMQILESMPWKRIRHLKIDMNLETVGTCAMKALVDGKNMVDGSVGLEFFGINSSCANTALAEQAALLKSFVATVSLKTFELNVPMTLTDIRTLLKTADVSRLEELRVWTKGYLSEQVGGVLDCLANAHNLRRVVLISNVPTQDEIRNMRAKGITLRGSNNSNSSSSVDRERKSQLLDRSQFFTDNSSHM